MFNYPRITTLPTDYIRTKIVQIMSEDIPEDDFTSLATIPAGSRSVAFIESLEEIVFAGEPIIREFFGEDYKLKLFAKDGDLVYKNGIIAEIEGPTIDLLKKERSMLNIIQRLSGIATETAKYVEKTKPYGIKILDTRKTTPLLRLFEKYAVTVGGAYNHRLDLSSAILIKDNHIKASGSISNAIKGAANYNLNIEIEAESMTEIEEICNNKINGILLDNMNPEITKKAVDYIRTKFTADEVYIISSGGINLKNIDEYLTTGIDGISIGAITHSVKATDIRLEIGEAK